MLDVKDALNNFKPINLDLVEERSGKLPDNIAEAIKLYNKALEDAQFKSEDMAIIALKKAISLHPDFYEAMNLLGVCYVMVGKEDKAKAAFQQVINAGDTSIKALDYLKKLKSPEEEEIEVKAPKKKSKKTEKENRLSFSLIKALMPEDNNLYFLKYIAGFVAGVLLVSLIWYMVPADKALFTIKKVENIDKNPELEKEITVLKERIDKLEQDLREQSDENLKLMDNFQSYREWITRLNEANKEYRNGNFIQSADLLFDAQGTTVPEELYEHYKELWDKVRLEAAEKLYYEGNKIYNGNRNRAPEVYKQALEKYEASITYIEDDRVSYQASLYYQAGKAAARCDEKDRAMELFEFIIKEYPNSSMSSYATSRLNELKAGKDISGS
ncbi:MAG: nucleotide exchange factor GrpE [Clostridiaceae bacterium]|nr:nucleotide exchange factor GrpE [Clostridiaceae bacterium]